MKFFHLSDLHIGKQLYSYSLLQNQREVLEQIVERAREERPDAILICGDVFDKSIPSGEAYTLLDEFFMALSALEPKIPVFVIAGNHDSGERLGYAKGFLEENKIYLSVFPPMKEGEYLKKVTLTDSFGEVDFYLLPFLKPGYVRHLFPEGAVTDYESAVRLVLEREQVDESRRNVLLSHQFYKSESQIPQTCDSEQVSLSVGGLDSVDVSVVEGFDYVALGHLHGPQKVKAPHIRYCGTPLKYSISEENHQKSITVVELGKKGEEPKMKTIPLEARQDVRRIRGTLAEVLEAGEEGGKEDFVSVTLTDEGELYRPKEKLDEIYEYLLEVRLDNARTRIQAEGEAGELQLENPLEAFRLFYEEIQHEPMSSREEEFFNRILERAREEE